MTVPFKKRSWINAVLGAPLLLLFSACSQSSGGAPEPVIQVRDATRSIDGSGNSLQFPEMGKAGSMLARQAESDYADDVSQMSGANRPNPRIVSNIVNRHPASGRLNSINASDFVWQWGQFLDHDIVFTDIAEPAEVAVIPIPMGDPQFDPAGTGTRSMDFKRSVYALETGTGADNPRQQLNLITTWIDASNVYGSDATRATALRTNDGTGRLKTSEGELLPFNVDGLPNADSPDPGLFLAGDVRANEQSALAAMHTLFVREHNRLAESIREINPEHTGEQIYQSARRIVGAQMQFITFNEFLPVLLGPDAIAPYRGHDPNVDASISNVFSASLYRFGHSALSSTLLRLDSDGNEIQHGNLPLHDAFFAPNRILDEGGIEPLLRGLSKQVHEEVDVFVVDAVRNMMFGPPGAGGLDLAALNIQRGRDHGLPSYNETRAAYGLPPRENWTEISSDPEIQTRLSQAYATVDDIDVWVGAVAEDHVSGMVGELLFLALTSQFEALRDGDRYWYELTLLPRERQEVTTLANIIRRNTSIGSEIQDNVFVVP